MSASPQFPASYLAQTRVPQLLAGAIIPVAIASVFVLARVYSRAILIHGWGYDDMAIIIAWTSSIVLTIVSAISARFGNGKHIEALILSQAEPGLKLTYVFRLLYLHVITACKYAFCATYLRIFQDRTSRRIIWCLTGFITIYTIPIFFATAFPCLPPSNVWHITTTKSCYDGPKAAALTYATGSFNVLGDLLLLGFIIPQLLPLKMPRRQKAALLSVASLSILVVVAALVRMVLVARSISSPDPTWSLVPISTWSSVEVNTALVCVSAPAIKPLVRKVFPGVFAPSSNQSYGGETRATIDMRKARKPRGLSFGDGEEEHEFNDFDKGRFRQSLESGQFEEGKSKAASDDNSSERRILTDTIAPAKIRGENKGTESVTTFYGVTE